MILTLAAVGRLRAQEPEQALALDWIQRAEATGRALGIRPVRMVEVDPRTRDPDPAREAGLLLDAVSPGARVILLDERGASPGSAGFARMLERARDGGAREVALLVGGADGHGEAARAAAHETWGFGSWTWPHRLVRAMAAEQMYRALSILAGAPYHRA